MTIHSIGAATVQKIFELDLDGMRLDQLMPDIDLDLVGRHPDWFPEGTVDGAGHAVMSVHSWLVRFRNRTILIDTGVGNGKLRPRQPALNDLSTPFLERLAEAGVRPGDIDLVVHTHIHSDHVGWNTHRADERWMPTFPRAEIVCSDREWRYGSALSSGDEATADQIRREAGLGRPVRTPLPGTFEDSMQPVAAQVRRLSTDAGEILPGLRLVPTPGHSIDHASIELRSEGEVALFTGDVFHHPAEVYDTALVSAFCEFPDAARRSRQWFLDHAVRTNATVFTSHLPGSSTGRVSRRPDGYAWTFA